jgi:mannosyltransferase OCH1-like enzyme
MVIVNNLLPRNDICIKNNLEFIYNKIDDMHIVCYYIDKNRIKIISRRLDLESGWGQDIKIKLFNLENNKFEIISIGSGFYNEKIIIYYTAIDIYPIEYNIQKIPKIIIQTTFNKDIKNILHYNSILTFIELNPEYQYILFDDSECRFFIKNNFDDDILKAYDLLVAGSFKADLFRYCYLYINGGCYFDCKQILRCPLRTLIQPDDEFILCHDIDNAYFNAVMMSKIKNEKLFRVIELCKNKILYFNNYYNINHKDFNLARTFLSLTGPHLLYECISKDSDINQSIKLFHCLRHNMNHEYQKLLIEYNNNLFITKEFKGYVSTNHYSNLWYKKEILYFNHIKYNDYYFYVYPNSRNTYEFYILNNNNLLIKREINNNDNLNLKIINEKINEQYFLNIPFSNKLFTLVRTDGIFSYNKNIEYVDSFKIIDSQYNDKFEVNIIFDYNNKKKVIVKRIDSEEGWDQDLKICCYASIESIDIHVGPSKENYIIKEI